MESVMRTIFANLPKNISGVTAIEYGLIAALIAIAAIAAMNTVGTSLSGVFTTLSNSL
jgi:pilus assembly protein Flp/PilA